jgi:hypothetical protein
VEARRRDRRGEAAEQGERVEVDGDGAVAERLLQGDSDEAIGAWQEPFGGDGWAQDVLEEGLAALVVLGTGAGGGVEAEAELWSLALFHRLSVTLHRDAPGAFSRCA